MCFDWRGGFLQHSKRHRRIAQYYMPIKTIPKKEQQQRALTSKDSLWKPCLSRFGSTVLKQIYPISPLRVFAQLKPRCRRSKLCFRLWSEHEIGRHSLISGDGYFLALTSVSPLPGRD